MSLYQVVVLAALAATVHRSRSAARALGWRGLPRRDPPARVAARPLGHPARAPSAAERRSGAKKGMRLAGVAPPSLCARCAGLSPASCATPPLGRAPPPAMALGRGSGRERRPRKKGLRRAAARLGLTGCLCLGWCSRRRGGGGRGGSGLVGRVRLAVPPPRLSPRPCGALSQLVVSACMSPV